MTVKAFAPAKINLTLHITGQRDDGYHLLDSLVVFADIGDQIVMSPQDDLSIKVTGKFAEGVPTDQRNLVWKAAESAGWAGQICLDKVLPHGAGIGGGSSDAAAVLRSLSAQGLPVAKDFEVSLGADIPVCMAARASRMQGIGEQVSPVGLPNLPAVLVNPGVHVPTGTVFSAMAQRDNSPMPPSIPDFETPADVAVWLAEQRNDLQVPAAAIAPQIDQVLSELNCMGNAMLARMSGSGATCFALFPTVMAAQRAAKQLGSAHPDWWVQSTTLS